jgi:hypothetical protein
MIQGTPEAPQSTSKSRLKLARLLLRIPPHLWTLNLLQRLTPTSSHPAKGREQNLRPRRQL